MALMATRIPGAPQARHQGAGSVRFARGPETVVWLRAFPEEASRDELKRAFYEGPEWTGELEELLMPLLEEYAAVLVEDHDGVWERWPDE